jgi:zinc protease
VPSGRFDDLLEAAGGWNNGYTNGDTTIYVEQVPANQLELALWLEADRMAGLWDAMNQTVLDQQRDVVKNERRQSYENQPYGMASLAVQSALWPEGHGYHHPTIGSMADLTAASLDDVEAFWRTWYVPSNATLVIVGGIDAAATKALVEKYFGWIPAAPRPEARKLDGAVAVRESAAELTATDQVQAAKVSVTWRADAPYTADAFALDVVAQVLGGGKTSRLYRRLVMQDRIASEVYAGHGSQVLGGEFAIEAIVRPGVDPATVRAAIAEEVERLRSTAVDDKEVLRAKRVLEAERVAGLENLSSRADAIAEWLALTGDPDHLAEELAALRKVGAAEMQAATRTWLRADASVTMTVTPEVKP